MKHGQTRLGSWVEVWCNIFIGFAINYIANLLILPLFGFHTLTLWKNFEIGLLYTVISVARQFVLRRSFNAIKRSWNYHHPVRQEVGRR